MRPLHAIGVLAASCAALGLTVIPAAASTSDAPLPSTFTLTAASANNPVRTVQLTCYPAGGTHPNSEAACAELVGSDGDFSHLPVPDQHRFCTMLYMPIEVSATGEWRGRPVVFRTTYDNPCVRDNLSGVMFRF